MFSTSTPYGGTACVGRRLPARPWGRRAVAEPRRLWRVNSNRCALDEAVGALPAGNLGQACPALPSC